MVISLGDDDGTTARGEESGEQRRATDDGLGQGQQAKKEKDLSGAVDSIIRFRIRIRGHYLSAGQIPASLLAAHIPYHHPSPVQELSNLRNHISINISITNERTNDERRNHLV